MSLLSLPVADALIYYKWNTTVVLAVVLFENFCNSILELNMRLYQRYMRKLKRINA